MATYRAATRRSRRAGGRVMAVGAERRDPMGASAPPETTFQRAKPIALGLVLAVLALIGLWLLVQLRSILVLVFVAVLFASAIARPAAKLERRGLPRGLAVVVVQLAVLAVLMVVFWIVVPPLVDQVALFSRDAPSYVTRFQHVRDEYLSVKRHYPEAATFDSQMASLGGKIASSVGGQLVNVPLTAAKLLFDLTMIYAIATLLVLRRERLLAAFLLLVSPAQRDRTQDVMEKIWIRLGGYLRAKVIVMVCVGILMYGALRLLGIPFAVPLAVIVAFGELIPKIGVWIARIPLLTVAAFHGGWVTLGLAFLASYLIEDLKAYVISPRAEGHALSMDPLLALLAVLCGTVLLGWQGALIAVPFAAMLQVVFEEVILPWRTAAVARLEPAKPLPDLSE
jgi:predicted PurR-regulated permease PerM